ncbi:hypothetical protein NCCP2716_05420 [Sporosarcina sp. NCCP-2716]|uniref:hypothetical protein n=1 Tax=Sporosarcina sp. NCCP-2716 TaxID=2943679 RepID=UPI00203AC2FC|nr:hypothetical protein [Sporosarcina sp. NCCP-2716]GKV68044.1 hypothetical protein NCCP2716_05420 [Sporosarcina sp. NCCP-2716]
MRKLFEMGSFLSIEDWSTLKLLGGYELVRITPDSVLLRKEGFEIELHGTGFEFDMLLENSALLSFTELQELRIVKQRADGALS